MSYGLTEIIHSYGFVSVFVTALTFRHVHHLHHFYRETHDVTEQIEHLAMMVLLLLFGGALETGPLGALVWTNIVAAALILLLIRSATGLLGLRGPQPSGSGCQSGTSAGTAGPGQWKFLFFART